MLKERIIEISQKYKLSHIGSCISSIDIIEKMYNAMDGGDKFVLSCGHAHLAHLVVKESLGLCDAEKEIQHDIHCNFESGCDAATGSLGMGCSIALGMAMANPDICVYLLTSDAEMDEGVVWEVLRIKSEGNVNNLIWMVNANGYGALRDIDIDYLEKRIHAFCPDVMVCRTDFGGYDFLNGVDAHYTTI